MLITSLEIGPIQKLKNCTDIYAIQFERLTVSGPCTLHEFLNEQSPDPHDGLYNPKIAIAKVPNFIIAGQTGLKALVSLVKVEGSRRKY